MKKIIVLSLVLGFLLTSCSSIMNGSKDKVNIKSTPDGASITVDGNKMGVTPSVVQLQRGETHLVEIQKAGFSKYTLTTGKSITGWFWGNLLCGGLIGIVIDLATGSAYDVDPHNIIATLDKGDNSSNDYFIYENFTSLTILSDEGDNLGQLKIEWID